MSMLAIINQVNMIRQLSTQLSSSGLNRKKLLELLTDLSEHSQQTLVGGSSQGRGNAGQIEPPPIVLKKYA